MENEFETYKRLEEILAPDLAAAQEAARDANTKFVHYTSASAALDILKKKCLWMRNATLMNDLSELRHGQKCVEEVFGTDTGADLLHALEACHAGLGAALGARYGELIPRLPEHTYLACFTAHDEQDEAHGRLSMWRSYGTKTGVALVFNSGPFLRPSSALNSWFVPVQYLGVEGIRDQIKQMTENVRAEQKWIASLPQESVLDMAFRVLVNLIVSSKHVGFKEEREWRIVHFPLIWAAAPDHLPLEQICLDDIPQPIFKVPFQDHPDEGLYGASLPDILDRVIVGPTPHFSAMRIAFAQALEAAEVQNAISKIFQSDVPLRS